MGTLAYGALGVNLVAAAGAVTLIMLVTFTVGERIGKHSVVDTTWGLGFVAIAVLTFALSASSGEPLRRLLVLLLPVLWGLRLAWHIGRRNAGQPEDPRYADIFARHQGSRARVALRRVYLPQAVGMWFVSLPIQVAGHLDAKVSWVGWLGVLVWAVGITFESVGDAQLARFKADPANRGRVLDSGLWRYTRHPNYFGDACVWWGVWLLAASSWLGFATVVAPAAMTWLLAAGTGKPLTEETMRERPGYAAYVARTSGFLPLPPGLRSRLRRDPGHA